MTAGGRRDARRIEEGLGGWLRANCADGSRPLVIAVDHPSGGLSNETLLVTVADDATRATERIVVRLPALYPSFPHLDLEAQASLHRVLARSGIPAPTPVTFEPDPSWLGDPFLVMPHLEGHVVGEAPVLDPWISDATPHQQRTVEDGFADLLARLHRLDWHAAGAGTIVRGTGGGLETEIRWWREYLDWAADGEPMGRLVELLDWCARTQPAADTPPSLLWGDARLGNLILDEDRRIVAALDWETASIGPAESDVAWYLALDAVLRQLTDGRAVLGFRDRDAFVDRYERRLGRALHDLGWHEIFALLRASSVMYRQALVAARAGRGHPAAASERNPLLAIADRWIADWSAT